MAIIKPEQLASGSYNITGSLFGTASTASHYEGSVESSSYALTASYALNGGGGGSIDTGSLIITSSLDGNNLVFTKGNGSTYPINLSAITSATASYVENAQSASYYVETDPLFVSKSGSLATTGSNTFNGNQTILGDIVVRGTASVDVFHSIYNTSSIIYSSGSTKFGDTLDDTHEFTGSVYISGSLYAPTIVGSLSGTASYSTTSSYVQNAQTASYYGGSVTSASYATTASYVTIAISSSFASSGIGLFSGSFSGSLSGDGSSITNLSFALGSVLFVSPSGSDTDTTRAYHIGNIHKPFLTLQAARNAAISGDLIYVLPQTIIFDNTTGAYNSNLNDLNMWKDGVTYYWSPGTRVQISNIIGNTLNRISFFNPSGSVGGTCATLGSLEYSQTTTGGPPTYGAIYYFQDLNNPGSYTFFSQTKSQIGYSNEIINVNRDSIATTSSASITIISDYEKVTHATQMDGTGAGNYVSGGDNVLTFNSYVKDRYYATLFGFNCRYNFSRSNVNFFGETMYITYGVGEFFTKIIDLRYVFGPINVDIKKTTIFEHSSNTNASGIYARSGNDGVGGGVILNYRGDIIEVSNTGSALALFRIDSPSNTINYYGNISTYASGSGRIISSVAGASTVNINGDINYNGPGTATQPIFYSNNASANTNYKGYINGNFAAPVTQNLNGTININHSNITSRISGSNSTIIYNGGSTLSTTRIQNSTINLTTSGSIGNGAYVKALISNSTIVNSYASGSGITNAGSNGTLNILNSTIISPSSSINYPSGSTVVMANAVVNSPYIISNPIGDINIVTDIQF